MFLRLKFRTFTRSEKRQILEEIFSKIVIAGERTAHLHIKKAPKEEAFLTTANKSSDSESNGGTWSF